MRFRIGQIDPLRRERGADARFERDYRQNLVRSILRERPRLSALAKIIIDDQIGDVYEDHCGQCTVHDQFPLQVDLSPEAVDCGREGIKLIYLPCLAQKQI